MTKVINLCLCFLLLSCNFSALAAEDLRESEVFSGKVSGRMTLATDYVFRGESETADGDIPAVQVDFTWTHISNSYIGLFSSTNKFTSSPSVRAVVAPYVGKSGQLNWGEINYNIFLFHYLYPDARALDYTELWINASKSISGTRIGLEVTPTLNDWFGVDDWDGINYALHVTRPFTDNISLSASVGHQQLDGEGAEGWLHWNFGIKHQLAGVELDYRYHDSNIDSSHKVYGSPSGQDIFNSRLVFGLSKSF